MSDFTTPQHILQGKGCLNDAKQYLVSYGKKALIVTGKHVVKSEMMKQLKSILQECSIEYAVFDDITGEPTDDMIEKGKVFYLENGCDFGIGIGGGSPLDSAKAIVAMITNCGNISDYNGKAIENPLPPLVLIPTTAGTGSEATKFSVITDAKKDIKMLLKGDCLLPTLAVVDYTYTMSSPKSVTVATGLDALTHAIEAFTSKKATPLTDSLAKDAIVKIMSNLETVVNEPQNELAREQMAIASLEAGICINNSSVTLVHGMSRPIGALFHVAHGISNAMLLSECLKFAKDGATEKFEQLALAVGIEKSTENLADSFLQKVEQLCKNCGVPTLTKYGIDKDKFLSLVDKMSKDAVDSGSPSNTVKTVTVDDCKAIYKKLIEL